MRPRLAGPEAPAALFERAQRRRRRRRVNRRRAVALRGRSGRKGLTPRLHRQQTTRGRDTTTPVRYRNPNSGRARAVMALLAGVDGAGARRGLRTRGAARSPFPAQSVWSLAAAGAAARCGGTRARDTRPPRSPRPAPSLRAVGRPRAPRGLCIPLQEQQADAQIELSRSAARVSADDTGEPSRGVGIVLLAVRLQRPCKIIDLGSGLVLRAAQTRTAARVGGRSPSRAQGPTASAGPAPRQPLSWPGRSPAAPTTSRRAPRSRARPRAPRRGAAAATAGADDPSVEPPAARRILPHLRTDACQDPRACGGVTSTSTDASSRASRRAWHRPHAPWLATQKRLWQRARLRRTQHVRRRVAHRPDTPLSSRRGRPDLRWPFT